MAPKIYFQSFLKIAKYVLFGDVLFAHSSTLLFVYSSVLLILYLLYSGRVCLNTADDRRSPKHDRRTPVLDLSEHCRSLQITEPGRALIHTLTPKP